ncbi:MAG: TRAP transporter small permease subunit [Granulosicoccus sp.]
MISPELDADDIPVVISDPGEKDRAEHLWGDRLVIQVGNVVAWIFPILMLAIVTQVFIRKAGHNQAWLDDAQWWLYGFTVLTAFCYAITTESHVRVDIFHQNYSVKRRSRTEVFALGWLLLPFLGIMVDIMVQYAWSSILSGEGSDSPNGLHRLYLLKATLPCLFVLAVIAGVSRLVRHLSRLTYPNVWKILLACFPFSWFVAERLSHYVLWWYIRFTQPDLASRRIAKEPLLEQSTMIGLAVVLGLVALTFFKKRPQSEI